MREIKQINPVNEQQNRITFLRSAIERNDLNKVSEQLGQFNDDELKQLFGSPFSNPTSNPLQLAVEKGNDETFNLLIETLQRIGGNKNNQFLTLGVITAINQNKIERLKSLIEAGADINHRVVNVFSACMEAMEGSFDQYQQVTPLFQAIMFGNKEAVSILLQNGADANQPSEVLVADNYNFTAAESRMKFNLHTATIRQQEDIVGELIDNGKVDVNQLDLNGKTALELVLDSESNKVIAKLLEKGAVIEKDMLERITHSSLVKAITAANFSDYMTFLEKHTRNPEVCEIITRALYSKKKDGCLALPDRPNTKANPKAVAGALKNRAINLGNESKKQEFIVFKANMLTDFHRYFDRPSKNHVSRCDDIIEAIEVANTLKPIKDKIEKSKKEAEAAIEKTTTASKVLNKLNPFSGNKTTNTNTTEDKSIDPWKSCDPNSYLYEKIKIWHDIIANQGEKFTPADTSNNNNNAQSKENNTEHHPSPKVAQHSRLKLLRNLVNSTTDHKDFIERTLNELDDATLKLVFGSIISAEETNPLQIAVVKGKKSVVELFIKRFKSFVPEGEKNPYLSTGLFSAAKLVKSDMAELLLSNGADPNVHIFTAQICKYVQEGSYTTFFFSSINYGQSLHYAISESKAANIEPLIKHGADVNSWSECYFRDNSIFSNVEFRQLTPLMISSQTDQTSILQSLINHKADIEKARLNGRTALFWAMFNEKPFATEFLLRKGAKFSAVKFNQIEIFSGLIKCFDNKLLFNDFNGFISFMRKHVQDPHLCELITCHYKKVGRSYHQIAGQFHPRAISDALRTYSQQETKSEKLEVGESITFDPENNELDKCVFTKMSILTDFHNYYKNPVRKHDSRCEDIIEKLSKAKDMDAVREIIQKEHKCAEKAPKQTTSGKVVNKTVNYFFNSNNNNNNNQVQEMKDMNVESEQNSKDLGEWSSVAPNSYLARTLRKWNAELEIKQVNTSRFSK